MSLYQREVWGYRDSRGRGLGFVPRYGVLIPFDPTRSSITVDQETHARLDAHANRYPVPETPAAITEIHLVTTLTCPAKCTYCCVSHVSSAEYLSPENAVRALRHLNSSPTSVSIFGGEPLTQPARLDAVLTAIRPLLAPGATMDVATGLLLSPAVFEQAITVLLKHNVSASLTIDNPDPGTAYTRGSNRLEDIAREFRMATWLHARGVNISVSSTLTRTSRRPGALLRRVLEDIDPDIRVGYTPLMVMAPDQALTPSDLEIAEADITDFLAYKIGLGHPPSSWPRPCPEIVARGDFWRAGAHFCGAHVTTMAIMPDGGIGGCFTTPELGAGLRVPTEDSARAWRDPAREYCQGCEMRGGCSIVCPKATPRGTAIDCANVNRAFYRPIIRALIEHGDPAFLDAAMTAQQIDFEA